MGIYDIDYCRGCGVIVGHHEDYCLECYNQLCSRLKGYKMTDGNFSQAQPQNALKQQLQTWTPQPTNKPGKPIPSWVWAVVGVGLVLASLAVHFFSK